MVVMCDASDITEHNRRTPELSNAAFYMKQDNDSIEKKYSKPKLIKLIKL